MKISVHQGSGAVNDYDVDPDETVDQLKYRIEGNTGQPYDLQTLMFSGVKLQNDRTLKSYGIGEGSRVHVVVRLI